VPIDYRQFLAEAAPVNPFFLALCFGLSETHFNLLCTVLQKPSSFFEEYLLRDQLFGGTPKDEFILQPPRVDRLYAIYGILFVSLST